MNWELLALIAFSLLPIAATLSLGVSVNGPLSIGMNRQVDADGGSYKDPAVPRAFSGSLTTRTDNDTGTITLDPGHSITTGLKVDIYWEVAGVKGMRYNVTVGTVAGNSMPFDLGSGDNLPTAPNAVQVCKRVQVSVDIDGDVLALLAYQLKFGLAPNSTAVGHIDFQDGSSAEIDEQDIKANRVRTFDIEAGDDNPFTGNPITKCFVSHNSTTIDAQLLMQWLQDSTP